MADLVVRRWRRYGKDRLYVNDNAGATVGWVDLITGDRRVVDLAQMAAFDQAVAGSGLVPKSEEAPIPQPGMQAPAEPIARSLAANVPGQAARRQMGALRQAAPVRSFFARLFGIRNEERDWRVGWQGERMVAKQLARLNRHWRVLHSVPVGSGMSDIDHVVIGPAGVFTLNTKHHPGGSVWIGGDVALVNGQRVPYARNSRHEADRASRLLSAAVGFPVPVRGIVVVAGARRLTVREQPRDGRTLVVARRKIAKWLQRQPWALAEDQVSRIYDGACKPETWVRSQAIGSSASFTR